MSTCHEENRRTALLAASQCMGGASTTGAEVTARADIFLEWLEEDTEEFKEHPSYDSDRYRTVRGPQWTIHLARMTAQGLTLCGAAVGEHWSYMGADGWHPDCRSCLARLRSEAG